MNRLRAHHSSEKSEINGDGNQENATTFMWIDLAEAIRNHVKTGLEGRDTVNVAKEQGRTLLSVLDTVQSVCESKVPFEVTHEPVIDRHDEEQSHLVQLIFGRCQYRLYSS